MWVLRLQQLRITVIKQNSVALVIRHWRNVHNYSRRERKMTWIRKEIKNEPQHLGCAGCKSSGEPPSLPHSAPPPPAAAPGASPAALTSPAETRSADEINITVAPTSPTYWDPLLDVMKEKKATQNQTVATKPPGQSNYVHIIIIFSTSTSFIGVCMLFSDNSIYIAINVAFPVEEMTEK